jgi:antitoxin component YwqK of YwqJK toxin-antitoxin module
MIKLINQQTMNLKWIPILMLFFFFSCQEKGVTFKNDITEINQETKTGESIEKYPNGTVKIKGDLVKGLRQGLWESFYDSGVKWSESNYLFGIREGAYKIFYPNGKLKIHGAYKNEQKSGIWYFYNKEGKFEKEIDFDKEQGDETN